MRRLLPGDQERLFSFLRIRQGNGRNRSHPTADYLNRLYKEGKLKFKGELPWKVTYHDPCHTGRHLNKFIIDHEGKQLWEGAYLDVDQSECLYEQPRDLLKAIPGIEFVEMNRIGPTRSVAAAEEE